MESNDNIKIEFWEDEETGNVPFFDLVDNLESKDKELVFEKIKHYQKMTFKELLTKNKNKIDYLKGKKYKKIKPKPIEVSIRSASMPIRFLGYRRGNSLIIVAGVTDSLTNNKKFNKIIKFYINKVQLN